VPICSGRRGAGMQVWNRAVLFGRTSVARHRRARVEHATRSVVLSGEKRTVTCAPKRSTVPSPMSALDRQGLHEVGSLARRRSSRRCFGPEPWRGNDQPRHRLSL
jgi:hypothetical protein